MRALFQVTDLLLYPHIVEGGRELSGDFYKGARVTQLVGHWIFDLGSNHDLPVLFVGLNPVLGYVLTPQILLGILFLCSSPAHYLSQNIKINIKK